MSRIIAFSVLGLICLATSPLGLGQTSLIQGRDHRLEDAQADIALLKRVIKEQDRRIADLEKTVKALQAGTAVIPDRPSVEERVKNTTKPFAARWQNPFAWSQIREGLSRAQVEELLGKPTSVEAVIDYQTLIYSGDVPGAGTLSGTVKLTDDRVSQVSPPGF